VGLGMVIVKHFFQRLDLHWFEHAGLLGNRQQDRRVGVAGVTYRELLARVFAIGCWLHWSLLVRKGSPENSGALLMAGVHEACHDVAEQIRGGEADEISL